MEQKTWQIIIYTLLALIGALMIARPIVDLVVASKDGTIQIYISLVIILVDLIVFSRCAYLIKKEGNQVFKQMWIIFSALLLSFIVLIILSQLMGSFSEYPSYHQAKLIIDILAVIISFVGTIVSYIYKKTFMAETEGSGHQA